MDHLHKILFIIIFGVVSKDLHPFEFVSGYLRSVLNYKLQQNHSNEVSKDFCNFSVAVFVHFALPGFAFATRGSARSNLS